MTTSLTWHRLNPVPPRPVLGAPTANALAGTRLLAISEAVRASIKSTRMSGQVLRTAACPGYPGRAGLTGRAEVQVMEPKHGLMNARPFAFA